MNLIVPVNEGITQDQRDQLDTLRKGKAPIQDAPHDQASGHATQKRREEQVRQRSSDEDADCDRNFKRNRRMSSNENPFMSKYMIFIASLWNDICEKLRETLVESVSSFKGSVAKQLHFMKRDGVDLSSLENRVDRLFKKAEDYDKIWSQLSEAMPVEAQVMELCLAQGVLKDAQQKLSKTQTLLSEQQKILEDCDGQVTLIEEAIKEAEKTIKDSREELTKIHDVRPKLQDLVTKSQEHHNTSREVMISTE
nr:uncharacterized protein LOC109157601 [Ipomoea batatas]